MKAIDCHINHLLFCGRKAAVLKNRNEKTICVRGNATFEDFVHYKDFDRSIDINMLQMVYDEDTKEWYERNYYSTAIVHSTYKDNKYLTPQDREELKELEQYDINEFNVFALGQWGIVGGTYFDKHNITERKLEMEQHIDEVIRGEFTYKYKNQMIDDTSIKFVQDDFGSIRMYQKPISNTPYVIGCDTSGEGSDSNAAIVVDNITSVDVASIHMNSDEDIYARQLYCLGKWYGKRNNCSNDALIGVETNFSTHPQKELERLEYDHFYVREEEPDSFSGKIVKKFGFNTNKMTRPLMLSMLRTLVREKPHCLKDTILLTEALTFVKNEKGRPEAMKGKHDDMIMARAISIYIGGQQHQTEVDTFEEMDISKLPKALQDDYEAEKIETRPLLLKEWRKLGYL